MKGHRLREVLIDGAGRIVDVQTRRPWLALSIGLLATLLAWPMARGLELRTAFDQLLPESQEGVKEYRRVSDRLPSQSKMFVILEGGELALRRGLGDTLVRRLSALGPPDVVLAEDGVQEAKSFLVPRAALFAPIDELVRARDDLARRWSAAVARATDVALDDTDPGETPFDAERLRHLAGPHASLLDRFPDGYYQSSEGAIVVAVQTSVRPGDLDGAKKALEHVSHETADVASAPEYAGIHTGLTGDLVTGLSEYSAIRGDLISVGAVGLCLVLAVILLYFVRLRSVFALGLTIATGFRTP